RRVRLDGTRHRSEDGRALRGRDPQVQDRVLERPDGRVRAGTIRRRNSGSGRGACRRSGVDRRRRRLRGGSDAVRNGAPVRTRLDGRWRVAGARRGQNTSRSRGTDQMSRTPLIAGNWKMNKTIAEAEAFVSGLLPRIATAEYAEIA